MTSHDMIMDSLETLFDMDNLTKKGLSQIITTALREAGNAKLEEAAVWFENQSRIVKAKPELQAFPASLSEPICEILDGIPADIRSLIQKD